MPRFSGGPWDGEERDPLDGRHVARLDVVRVTDEAGDIHASLDDFWLEDVLPHGSYRWCQQGEHYHWCGWDDDDDDGSLVCLEHLPWMKDRM